MAEVTSTLGLAVDASHVTAANRELDRFAASGDKAARAADVFARATDKAANATDGLVNSSSGLERLAGQIFLKSTRDAETYLRVLDKVAGKEAERMRQSAMPRSAVNIDSRMGIGAQPSIGRGDDIEAYGKSLDNVRARFNPLFAAQRAYKTELDEINQSARIGAISETERAAAIKRTKDAFAAIVPTIGKTTAQVNGMSYAAQNLTFQLNDIASGLAMGQSPFMIMAQQGGQVLQILQTSNKGMGGLLKEVGGMLTGLIPRGAVLAGGALVAMAAGAGVALASYTSKQAETRLALTGIGRASQLTVQDINEAAAQSASILGQSESEARGVANALAATGKIGKESLSAILPIAKDLAATIGVDMADAGEEMAKAFSSFEGIDALNKKLGALDDKTRQSIKTLFDRGDRTGAQLAAVEAMRSSIAKANELTGFWAKSWDAVGNAASMAWTAIGKGMSNATGVGKTMQEKLADAEAQLNDNLEIRGRVSSFASYWSGWDEHIKSGQAEIAKLRAEIERTGLAASDAALRVRSIEAGNITRAQNPDIENKKEIFRQMFVLSEALKNARMKGMLDDVEATERAMQKLNGAWTTFMSTSQRAEQAHKIAMDAITARSPRQRADIARRQMELSLAGQPVTPQERIDRGHEAWTEALTQANRELSESQRERILSTEQAIKASKLELQTLGQTAGAIEAARMERQLLSQVEQEEARTGTKASDAHKQKIKELAAEYGGLAQAIAMAKLQSDVMFDRAQLGRSDTEAAIASRLRSVFGDSIESAQARFIANQMRINELLRISSDLAGDFASGLYKEMRSMAKEVSDGTRKSIDMVEALGKALERLADTLVDMALKQLMKKALGGLGGLDLGGLFGGGAPSHDVYPGGPPQLALGGIMTPRGPVSLKRYARGGVATKPQLAIFGEGSGPEAYVPLPDGRTIPVSLKMPEMPAVSSGGFAGRPVVNMRTTIVNEMPGAEVQENTSSDGLDKQIIIRQIGVGLAAEMSSNRGPLRRSVMATQRGNTYG